MSYLRLPLSLLGSAETPVASGDGAERTYTQKDIESTFTNLYCYSNLLKSVSDDNDTDHFRFIKFIQQVPCIQRHSA